MEVVTTWTKADKKGKIHTFKKVKAFGDKVFIIEVPAKGKALIEKDIETVAAILSKDVVNHFDRMQLLRIYNIAYHETGKIEGVWSLDSTATNCDYCRKMREYAAAHPELDIVCGYCYDFAQELYRYNTLNRHTLNMIIMESVEFEIEELATLPAGELVRVNSSGDSSNDTYAENMIKFCIAHPNSKCGIWSKHTITYIHACDKYGKPANVVLIQSSPFVNKPVKRAKYFDYVFTVYKSKEAVEKAIENGACECNGKKCADCGYKCYFGLWAEGANIAEFLRK